ncbi:MAG: transcriptional repressor [Candidatus Marinimicrobia bacterium]|nr:transcriptional repressor [Candidatus Neomarinimicrobiota bacterium]
MRHSTQRNTILNILRSTRSHPTADWIYNEARKELPNISLGTIYRNLNQLATHKMILTIPIDGVIHYDGFTHDHLHFICGECQNIYDVEIKAEEVASMINNSIDHHVADSQVNLTGTCSTCKPN